MRFRPLTLALLAMMTTALGDARGDVIADFEDIPLATGAFDNGDPGGLSPGDEVTNTFVTRGAGFNNTFGIDPDFAFPYWTGWSISSVVDTTTPGFGNQYASFAGGGSGGGGNYGIAYLSGPGAAFVNLPDLGPAPLGLSAEITNTTYAALSMRDGDGFSSPFGGVDGNRPDFLFLTITGYAGEGATGDVLGSVDFYLADYRFDDNSLDYIIDEWTTVDLSSLLDPGGPRLASLGFSMTVDPAHIDDVFGPTVPTYFALDDLRLTAVPEPSSLALLSLGAGGLALALRRRSRSA